MKALSGNRRSFAANLALAREGSGASPKEQERVARALRASGLTVPLVVAPGLSGVAQAATAVIKGNSVAAAASTSTGSTATTTAAASAAGTSSVATSGTLAASAKVSASAATLGGKLIASKLIAGKLAVALAVAGAGSVGVNAGYTLFTTPDPSANHAAVDRSTVDRGADNRSAVDESRRSEAAQLAPTAAAAAPNEREVAASPAVSIANEAETTAPLAGAARPKIAAPRAPTAPVNAFGEHKGGPTPERAVDDPVVVEMQHLKQVNRALTSGNPRLALQLLNTLDQEIPTGALQPERQVSRVLTLCALGETSQAKVLTQKLLAKGSSFYGRSLKHSCGSR